MKIKNLHFENALIFVPHFAGSYRIFVNKTPVAQSGEFSDGGAKANVSLTAIPITFEKDREYDIVIETFCALMPGLYMTPIIMDYSFAYNYFDLAKAIRCIIFGVVIFCGIFIFSYNINKSGMFSSKWLPLLAMFIGFRIIISTDGFAAFHMFFRNIDYEQLTPIICLSTFLIKLSALLFYKETLGLKIKKTIFIAFSVIFLLCTTAVSLLPEIVLTPNYYILIQASTLPLDIIILSSLADSVSRKVPFSIFYSIGYIAVISGIMVDCFYSNGLVQFVVSSFMPICFGFLVSTLTIIFSKKQSSVYKMSLKSAELNKELAVANTSIMISQIQPHFLYNALNTIKYLIKHDPKTAEKAVISFSRYLRGNMDSISNKEPIPFADELEHIKNYCDIELLRFEDRLHIIYDINCTDFDIPALSIQPMVENAIKHGVTKTPAGGTVTIASHEDDDFYIVTVTDTGIGFDKDNPNYSDEGSRSHLGIQNVANRLKAMVNASFDIQSKPGDGTRVTIKIPKEKG